MPLVGWTENLSKQFEQFIKGFLLVTPSLYNFFQANGLIRNVGEGVDKVTYPDAKKPEGGILASSIHDHNIIHPLWGETTVGLMYLVGKLQISQQDVDKFSNGKWIRGDLIQETLNQVMPVMLNQVDQIIAWGDEYKSAQDISQFNSSSEITGIFNGGTAINGGITGDNDMTAAGDYLYTVAQMRKALRAAGHEADQYMLLSDLETDIYSEIGNNFYSTVGVTEKQRVLEKKYIKDWMSSDNFIDATAAKYRMAMIAPKQKAANLVGNKLLANNFELLMGYNFKVIPLHNGGLSGEGYYESLIATSLRLVEYHATAIQRTGNLTLA